MGVSRQVEGAVSPEEPGIERSLDAANKSVRATGERRACGLWLVACSKWLVGKCAGRPLAGARGSVEVQEKSVWPVACGKWLVGRTSGLTPKPDPHVIEAAS